MESGKYLIRRVGGMYVIKMWNLYKVCLREKYFHNDELTKKGGWNGSK